MDPVMVPVIEACRISGIGRSMLCERIATGELKSTKVGARRLIHVDDLLDFIDRLRGADHERVDTLIEQIDQDGRLDVSAIPPGTTLSDLEAAKRVLSEGRGVPDEAA